MSSGCAQEPETQKSIRAIFLSNPISFQLYNLYYVKWVSLTFGP
jgi:hypothetical protein